MKLAVLILILFMHHITIARGDEDPFFGTWKLRTDKSDYSLAAPLIAATGAQGVYVAKAAPGVASFRTKDKGEMFGVGSQRPVDMTITMQAAEDGAGKIFYKSTTKYADGRVSNTEYTNGYTGVPAVVLTDGKLNAPVALGRETSKVVTATYFDGQKPIAVSRRVVSADGKAMTITTTSLDGNGNKVVSGLLFERQN